MTGAHERGARNISFYSIPNTELMKIASLFVPNHRPSFRRATARRSGSKIDERSRPSPRIRREKKEPRLPSEHLRGQWRPRAGTAQCVRASRVTRRVCAVGALRRRCRRSSYGPPDKQSRTLLLSRPYGFDVAASAAARFFFTPPSRVIPVPSANTRPPVSGIRCGVYDENKTSDRQTPPSPFPNACYPSVRPTKHTRGDGLSRIVRRGLIWIAVTRLLTP